MSFSDPLSDAIYVITSANNLSIDQIAALENKIASLRSAFRVQTIIDKINAVGEDLEKALRNKSSQQLWSLIALPLSGWEAAWQHKHDKTFLTNRSKNKRRYAKFSATAFDIRQLQEDQQNLLFVLAYAGIDPLRHSEYLQVWSGCCEHAGKGRVLRKRTIDHLRKDTLLSQALIGQAPASRKRKRTPREGKWTRLAREWLNNHVQQTQP